MVFEDYIYIRGPQKSGCMLYAKHGMDLSFLVIWICWLNPRSVIEGHFDPPLLPDFASNIHPLFWGASNIYVILKNH